MKYQFFLIFLAILLAVALASSCSVLLTVQQQELHTNLEESRQEDAAEKEETEDKSDEEAEEEEQEEPVPSYSFVGRVSGLSPEPEPEPEEKQEDLEVADSEKQDGYVPELTIETNGVDMASVAEHYGFVLALMTDDRLLGRVENGNLEEIDAAFLGRFAKRAREGDISADLRPLVDRLSNHLNKRVQAVYLVPNEVEQEFIRIQMEAIQQSGRSPRDVQLVRARYRRDYSIEVLDVI